MFGKPKNQYDISISDDYLDFPSLVKDGYVVDPPYSNVSGSNGFGGNVNGFYSNVGKSNGFYGNLSHAYHFAQMPNFEPVHSKIFVNKKIPFVGGNVSGHDYQQEKKIIMPYKPHKIMEQHEENIDDVDIFDDLEISDDEYSVENEDVQYEDVSILKIEEGDEKNIEDHFLVQPHKNNNTVKTSKQFPGKINNNRNNFLIVKQKENRQHIINTFKIDHKTEPNKYTLINPQLNGNNNPYAKYRKKYATQFYKKPSNRPIPSYTMMVPIELGKCKDNEILIDVNKLINELKITFLGDVFLVFTENVDIDKIELTSLNNVPLSTLYGNTLKTLEKLKVIKKSKDISHHNYTIHVPFFKTRECQSCELNTENIATLKITLKKQYPDVKLKMIVERSVSNYHLPNPIRNNFITPTELFHETINFDYTTKSKRIMLNHDFSNACYLVIKPSTDTNIDIKICGTLVLPLNDQLFDFQTIHFFDENINKKIMHEINDDLTDEDISGLYVVSFGPKKFSTEYTNFEYCSAGKKGLMLDITTYSNKNEFYSKVILDIFTVDLCVI